MKKIEAQTVRAVRDLFMMADFTGVYFRKGNMIVEQNHHGIPHTMGYRRIISARLHRSEIFAIEPYDNHAFYDSCGYQTNTTKSRLNVLMNCFSPQYGIYQKNFQWYLSGENTLSVRPDKQWEGSCWLPSRIDDYSYHWKQAEMLTK